MSFYDQLVEMRSGSARDGAREAEWERRSQCNVNFYAALPYSWSGGDLTDDQPMVGGVWIPVSGSMTVVLWVVGLPGLIEAKWSEGIQVGRPSRNLLTTLTNSHKYNMMFDNEMVAEDFVHLLNMARIDRQDKQELKDG